MCRDDSKDREWGRRSVNEGPVQSSSRVECGTQIPRNDPRHLRSLPEY
jgi:hypothetical protein